MKLLYISNHKPVKYYVFQYLLTSPTCMFQYLVSQPSLCNLAASQIPSQLNTTIDGDALCSALKQFLDNSPITANDTQYDWRNSLNETNVIFDVLAEYIDVSMKAGSYAGGFERSSVKH